MTSFGQFAISGVTNAIESTQALAKINLDFTLLKVDAPREYHDIGSLLAPGRRETAEEGKPHITARRLGAIFRPVLPETPHLIKAYGLHVSEIARDSADDVPKGLGYGIFSKQAGFDDTSIWAGATSGSAAIQVHLLACILARMWDGPQATSIWVELLNYRCQEAMNDSEKKGSFDIELLTAVKQGIDRQQLAEWDASARAWLRIADMSKLIQQKQLLLIIGSLNHHVNSQPVLHDSVMKAWKEGLDDMEALLRGSPLLMSSGGIYLALTSWHLYPDLNVLDTVTKIVRQKYALIPGSGIVTIGLQREGSSHSAGLHWSLPLAHLRYYGDPVLQSSTITRQGSRLSLEEFNMAILGCVLGGWNVRDQETHASISVISKLNKTVSEHLADQLGDSTTWLQFLGAAADSFLKSKELQRTVFQQLLSLGRKYKSFRGTPTMPFFGLLNVNLAVSLASQELKVEILRSQANSSGLRWNHAIIRYVSERTKEAEYASATPRPRTSTKRTISEEIVPKACHTRWVRSKPVAAEPEEHMSGGIYNPGGDSEEYMGYEKEPHKKQSNMAAQVPLRAKDWDLEYSEQSAHYIQMGEDVIPAESEPLVTISSADRGTQVIWGGTGLTESATWDAFDHWFGPMKHYEHWLGDHKSADIFIRMDKAAPEGLGLISLPQLQAVLDQAQLKRKTLAASMAKEMATKVQQFSNLLRAIAAMSSLYAGLKGATVDVRILSQAIEDTHWFRAFMGRVGQSSARNRPITNSNLEDKFPDETAVSGGPQEESTGSVAKPSDAIVDHAYEADMSSIGSSPHAFFDSMPEIPWPSKKNPFELEMRDEDV